jgi:hypothetical protein
MWGQPQDKPVIVYLFYFPSRSEDIEHRVTLTSEGRLRCSCKRFIYKKGSIRTCSHITHPFVLLYKEGYEQASKDIYEDV